MSIAHLRTSCSKCVRVSVFSFPPSIGSFVVTSTLSSVSFFFFRFTMAYINAHEETHSAIASANAMRTFVRVAGSE